MNLIRYYIRDFVKGRKLIKLYHPKKYIQPSKTLEIRSAWEGIEKIVGDILERFNIGRENCIEFGVEFGYSTVVFSNFFKQVTGVDTFEGDEHSLYKSNHYEDTKSKLSVYNNIELHKSDYKEWIKKDNKHYNFAHVDIIHSYNETYECGLWAVNHSDCTIFHDTDSFPAVRQAVIDIGKKTGRKLYNYPMSNGLGILVKLSK